MRLHLVDRFWLALGLIASFLACGPAVAAFSDPDIENAVAEFHEGKERAFQRALQLLSVSDETEESARQVVQRCAFLAHFLDDEGGDWVAAAESLHEDCIERLESDFAEVPEARVYLFEQKWSEEDSSVGEALLADSADWDRKLRRRVVEHLYWTQSGEQRTGRLAVMAAELGSVELLPEAVKHLVGRGRYEAASTLLTRSIPATTAWEANERLRAALTLPNPRFAAEELQRHVAFQDELDPAVLARIELSRGRVSEATLALQREPSIRSKDHTAVAFEVAMARRDWHSAAQQLGSVSEDFAPVLQRSLLLLKRHPAGALWMNLWPALAFLLMMMLLLALVPAVVLVPAHYRGLMRRARGQVLEPLFAHIGLKHAWLGCAVLFCVPMLAMMLVATDGLSDILEGEIKPGSSALYRSMLWGTLAAMFVLLPTLAKFGRRHLWADREVFAGSWRILMAQGLVWLVGAGLVLLSHGQSIETTQTRMVTALVADGRGNFGLPMTFMLLAVLVPVLEEWIFRGLLLGGLTHHLRFGWANLIQSVVFAMIHDDPPRFLYYLTLGLAAGWLVRWSRSLLPAVALHMLNNAVAVWLHTV